MLELGPDGRRHDPRIGNDPHTFNYVRINTSGTVAAGNNRLSVADRITRRTLCAQMYADRL